MNIAIFGSTLYAGVMATLLSEYGNNVFWCDHVEMDEYQLQQRLIKQNKVGRLTYGGVGDLNIDVALFCYSPSEIEVAKHQIATLAFLQNSLSTLLINGSTFGLHGTDQLKNILPDHEWCYLPDIIQEGNAVQSLLNTKQIMVGVKSNKGREGMLHLLRPLFGSEQQYLFMPILDAELAKLSISGMLATRISYMNDIALMAEKLGVDILNVKQGMAADSRIGATYLSPGTGFGGEHFSHDILTLSSEVSKTGIKSSLLEQVWHINEEQKEILFRKLWDYYDSDLVGKRVAIWGASFKENTSSIHNSPIHTMLKALWAQGVDVYLHDPQALDEMREIYGERSDLIYCEDEYDAIKNVDALCIMTAWKQYFSPNFPKLLQNMRHPLVLDGRNIYEPNQMKSLGFIYEGIGRK